VPAYADSDRRECPRLASRLNVQIGDLAVITTNISLTGVQVSCPLVFLEGLLRALKSNPVTVTIEFPGECTVRARCRVAYVEDYGDDYLAGLRFESFEANGFAVLEAHCRQHAAKERAAG